MPDGEELEQMINNQLDKERYQDAMIALEIESLHKAVEKSENVSGLAESKRREQGH